VGLLRNFRPQFDNQITIFYVLVPFEIEQVFTVEVVQVELFELTVLIQNAGADVFERRHIELQVVFGVLALLLVGALGL